MITFDSSVLSSCFEADQCTPGSFWESKDPHVLYINSHLSLKTDIKEYYEWDLSGKRSRDCIILELCRNSCISQQTFHFSAGLSQSDECFWLFGITWLTYDCLWFRDLTDDSLILEVSYHCKATLDRRTRTKCSVLKIRKEQFTYWHVENEFWSQKHACETDNLKNNLQLEVFDGESKPSGFIWLNWTYISFFNRCWSYRCQALSETLCLYQERCSKLKVRKILLTNHRKIIMWGHLRIAHKETHTVNNPRDSFSVL